jgi:hypothetical protein
MGNNHLSNKGAKMPGDSVAGKNQEREFQNLLKAAIPAIRIGA